MPAASSLRAGPSRRRHRLLTPTRQMGVGDSSSPPCTTRRSARESTLGAPRPAGSSCLVATP
eukprot:4107341-Alexandrium_andersonii.AAC.1